MNYLFFLLIFLIPFGIANALTSENNNPNPDFTVDESDNDGLCEDTGGSWVRTDGAGNILAGLDLAADVQDCYRGVFQWSLTSIPNYSTIQNTEFVAQITAIGTVPRNCDVWSLDYNSTGKSAGFIFRDAGNGTEYINNNNFCTTTGSKVLDLGASADSNIQAHILTDDFFGVGVKNDNEAGQDGNTHYAQIGAEEGATPPILRVTYKYTFNGVTTLVTTDIRPTGVDLSWNTPGGTGIDGYQINDTTPWSSNVLTIITSDTNSLATTASVSGLTGNTKYSFRLGTRSDNFVNASGNIVNFTTDTDPTGSFTPGSFNLNFTGVDIRTIKYVRTDINSSSLFLNVTAPHSYQLACNFHYKFANTNKTYATLSNSTVSSSEDKVGFRFNHVDNEIIDVTCSDQHTNASANYLITQNSFPFLEQIDNFRNGTYGTHGQFGSIDLITTIAIIVSMIGFNRVNESVGVIFSLIMIGGLAVLSNGGIINWAATYTVGFALVVMYAVGMTRKD